MSYYLWVTLYLLAELTLDTIVLLPHSWREFTFLITIFEFTEQFKHKGQLEYRHCGKQFNLYRNIEFKLILK